MHELRAPLTRGRLGGFAECAEAGATLTNHRLAEAVAIGAEPSSREDVRAALLPARLGDSWRPSTSASARRSATSFADASSPGRSSRGGP